MQAGQAHAQRYKSSLDGVLTILKEEGVEGLYKGVGSKLAQSVLTAAILFAGQKRIYEMTKKVSVCIVWRLVWYVADAEGVVGYDSGDREVMCKPSIYSYNGPVFERIATIVADSASKYEGEQWLQRANILAVRLVRFDIPFIRFVWMRNYLTVITNHRRL